jgi:hypothetical protein
VDPGIEAAGRPLSSERRVGSSLSALNVPDTGSKLTPAWMAAVSAGRAAS